MAGLAEGKTVEDIARMHGVSAKKIREQIKKGKKVEREHTDSKSEAVRISMDHLVESPEYYTELAKMEKKLEKKAAVVGSPGEFAGWVKKAYPVGSDIDWVPVQGDGEYGDTYNSRGQNLHEKTKPIMPGNIRGTVKVRRK